MFANAKEKLGAFFSSLTGRYSPAFITLTILAGFFFFYFTVVVDSNESELKERNFRGLRRMADNISKKVDNYVVNNSKNFFHALDNAKDSAVLKSVIEEQYHLKEDSLDDTIGNDKLFVVKFTDAWKIFFKKDTISKSRAPLASTTINEFIKPLLRRDFFSHYFLAAGDTILMDELNISFPRVHEYMEAAKTIAQDTVKKGNLIQTSQLWKVEINGKAYKLFLLPFVVEGECKFLLGGYMLEDDFVKQQKYIPTYAILWLAIGIMLVLLMFPLLKIFFMHRMEQLTARNAISSLGSIHVLGSLVVIAALNMYAYFAIVRPTANEGLKKLASDIDSAFNKEIDAAIRATDTAQMELNAKITGNRSYDTVDYRPKGYPYFLHISFANSAGIQRVRFANDSYLSEKINVKNRDYFQAVRSNDLWRRDNGDAFYLTEISSWVENRNLAIISRPISRKFLPKTDSGKSLADSLLMISLSGNFRSMFNPILPAGTGFCIIKENGDVLFHIDPSRNLNENLGEECGNSPAFWSLIRAKNDGFFGSTYSGSTQRFYIKPLKGMPYYIVTFTDMRSIWSEDMDVISACSVFTLMNLAVILIAILVIQIIGYRRTLLHHHTFLFPWLQPKEALLPAYKSVTFVYLAAVVLQSLFIIFYKGLDQLCLTGILFSYSFCLIGYAYYQFGIRGDKLNRKGSRAWKSLWVLISVYALTHILFLLNLGNDSRGIRVFMLSQLALLVVMFLIHFRKQLFGTGYTYCKETMVSVRKSFGTVENGKNYRWWFISSIFTFIVATGIVPSVLFYCMTYKQEKLLSLKNQQLEFATQLLNRRSDSDSAANNKPGFEFSYQTPFHFRCFADSIKKTGNTPPEGDSSINQFEILYENIKPSFSGYSKQIEYLKNKYNSNDIINWKYREDERQLILHYKMSRLNTYINDSMALTVHSHVESGVNKVARAISKDKVSFIILLLALGLVVGAFVWLLRLLIKKIFFDGFNDSNELSKLDEDFAKSLPVGGNIFVNGIADSGKSRMIETNFGTANIHEVDIARLAEEKTDPPKTDTLKTDLVKALEKNITIVLVAHFEMFMNDFSITEEKLRLLEFLHQQKNIRIIILSSRPFECMKLVKPKTETEAEKDLTDRWTNLMNKFYTVYYKWNECENKNNDPVLIKFQNKTVADCMIQIKKFFCLDHDITKNDKNKKAREELKKIMVFSKKQMDDFFKSLHEELSHSDFLWDLRAPILTFLEKEKLNCFKLDFQYSDESHMTKIVKRHFLTLHENICLKVQSLASRYYSSVWQSLSNDEQITLYDIAMDEMVNPVNRDYATRLADLGLIKRLDDVPGYRTINTSFRNFIFTQVDQREIDNFRNEAVEKGSWRSFQLPILIVVVAIGIFLFTTQKDAFGNLVTYLGAAIGGIGALLRVLGMIPASK